MLAISYPPSNSIPLFSPCSNFHFLYSLGKRHQKHLKLIYLRRVSKNSTKSPCRPCQANVRKELFSPFSLSRLMMMKRERRRESFFYEINRAKANIEQGKAFQVYLVKFKEDSFRLLHAMSRERKTKTEKFHQSIYFVLHHRLSHFIQD